MTWGNELFLFIGLPLWLVVLVARILWTHHLKRQQAGVGAANPEHIQSIHRGRQQLRLACLWLGAFALIITAAQPRWGSGMEERTARGSDLMILFDCSRSMLANDLHPNRLTVAKRKTQALLAACPENRFALMPFAGTNILRCPLTGDQSAIGKLLESCDPDLFSARSNLQGTAIGKSLKDAVDLLSNSGDQKRGQAVIIVSDGSDPDTELVEAAGKHASYAGIPVYGLFVGDPDKEVSLMIDGSEQVMTTSRETLDTLADLTGAICVNVSTDDSDIKLLSNHINDAIAQRSWTEERRTVAIEQYWVSLIPALALTLIGLLVPTARREGSESV